MNKVFLVPLFCLVSTNIWAGTMGEIRPQYDKVITLSGGPAWTSNGESQIIRLEPDLVKAYQAKKEDTTLGSGEVFLGVQRIASELFTYQLGIAFAASSAAYLSGSVWDDADPVYDNFFYNYKVDHTHVAAKAKLIANTHYWAQPYVSGSIGVGFNRSHNFTLIPKSTEQLLFNGFNSNTKNNFTYTVGAGLQKEINQHLSAGVGYEFADWGKSGLSPSIDQSINSVLTLNHLYTHQLQFSVSYTI